MRLEDAQKVIVRPYITERTFEQVERENKLCFVVGDESSKRQIAAAVEAVEAMLGDGLIVVSDAEMTRLVHGSPVPDGAEAK